MLARHKPNGSPYRNNAFNNMLISRESIQALMPHQSLMKINGEPTHVAMKRLKKELASNLIAVYCPWGHGCGYLSKLSPAALFQA